MNKLNAEWCRNHIESMKANGLSLLEEKYVQALEIALPVLDRIETVESGLEGALKLHRLRTAEEGHSQLSDSFRAGARWAARYTALSQLSTTPQIDNDGWIEWGGKGKPAEAQPKMVEVRFRDGSTATEVASLWRWSHFGDDCTNIIAYRVIENDGREG